MLQSYGSAMERAWVVPLHGTRRAAAWRESLGHVLRATREHQELRLVDVAERAGVSTQYLSEVERGRKEPSSEILLAVTTALGLTLADLALATARRLRGTTPAARVELARPVQPAPRETLLLAA